VSVLCSGPLEASDDPIIMNDGSVREFDLCLLSTDDDAHSFLASIDDGIGMKTVESLTSDLRLAEKSAQVNVPTSPLPILCAVLYAHTNVCGDESKPTILSPSRSAPGHSGSNSDGINLPHKRTLVRGAVSQ